MTGKQVKMLLAPYRAIASPSFWFWFPQNPVGCLQIVALVVLATAAELLRILAGRPYQ